MAWALPRYTKAQVDAAGRVLAREDATDSERDAALEIVGNWRAIHAFPLNTFQMRLRQRAAAIYENALVAQRLKRISSMEFKLRRIPKMNLARMQDIGGCRAVFRTPAEVRQLARDYKTSRIKHRLVGEKDYISNPKDSGYRGIHLIYRYNSDRKDTYNGLLIELQIRSRLQHAWATAVETVGTFLQHSLKSSMGPDEWLRFFSFSASCFALAEKCPLVPKTPVTKRALFREIRRMRRSLEVDQQLRAFGHALQITEADSPRESHFFLLSLVPGELKIWSYRKDQLDAATRDYLNLEKRNEVLVGAQAVLVAAESLKSLRRAYPNYYLDTQVFLRELTRASRE
jgi:hypothetical protein